MAIPFSANVGRSGKMKVKYKVRKLFLTGNLAGIEVVDISPVAFNIGEVYKLTGTKSTYRVIGCEKTEIVEVEI